MITNFEISKQQLQEIEDFYLFLGYSQSQAKLLSRSAFDSSVSGIDGAKYCKDWDFSLCASNPFTLRDVSWMNGCSSWVHGGVDGAYLIESWGAGSWGRDSASDSVITSSAAPISPEQSATFSTAQTHDAPELPEMNPMSDTEVIFSANVNSTSWSYVRNMARLGKQIDPSFVRIEEMINSASYELTEPQRDADFTITPQIGKCPWSRNKELLFLGIQAKHVQSEKKNNFVFLVDVSGSMHGNQIIVQMTLMAILSSMKAGDTVSIITYSDQSGQEVLRNK